MGGHENVQLVQEIYAAFGRGDIPGILGRLADDAEIEHFGPPDILPWARVYRGRDGWAQFFQDLGKTLEPLQFEPREFVAQDDKVVALGQWRFRATSTGRTSESPWAMVWTFRQGRPASCRIYEDTAAYVAVIRGE